MNKIALSVCIMLGLGGQLIAGEGEEKRVMLKEDFDSAGQSSPLAKRLLTHPHISPAKGEGVGGSNAIRVAYVGYARGSERVVVHFPLEGRALHATLSFDVKFDNDFQWVLGGKLHGLGPKLPITGGEQREPDGWSARIMFKKDGRCSTYLYDQDPTKKWGIGNTTKNPVFTAGQWSHVTLQVSLNDSGESNGWSRILIDNQEVVKTENVEFRDTDTDETLIQQFLFSTFHGGNQPEWSPVDKAGNPTTIYAWFDNFVVESGIQPGRFVGFD